MAYFDNAATTYPKPEEVYSFMDSFYKSCGGSAGRGNYSIANSARKLIDETRELIQELLNASSKQVVFTPTATIAINMIIQGVIANNVKTVYISPFEHNAITRTLYHFEKAGQIRVVELSVSESLEYDFQRIRYQFDSNKPDFVIASHASNVIGLISPIEKLFALAKEYNAVTLVDMAQTAGLVDLNVGLDTIDFAVFAGHKSLLGPTGISGFLMKPEYNLPPVLYGGTGYDSANQDMPSTIPEKYEMGTLNIVGIAGLNASVRWIKAKGLCCIFEEESKKREELIDLLKGYDYIRIIGDVENKKYVGIVSCLFNGISSDSIGSIFAERGIAVRTGLQCAPAAHRFMGTFPAGTVRFSVNCFTKKEDFEELKDTLDYIELTL